MKSKNGAGNYRLHTKGGLHEALENLRTVAKAEGVPAATLKDAEDAVTAAVIRKSYDTAAPVTTKRLHDHLFRGRA